MITKTTRIAAGILLLLMLAVFTISCASGNGDSAETTASQKQNESDEETTAAENMYEYPNVNYEGHEFIVLNAIETDWANVMFAPDELTGDLINDAMFNRNSFVEEKLNITIKDVQMDWSSMNSTARNLINASDDVYDVMMYQIHEVATPVTEGYFVDLYTIDSLNLDREWWDRIIIDNAEIGGKLFFASSDITLFPFEATWVCYFDETQFTNLGIEYPYESVRNGTWTIDKMLETLKQGINMGSESSWAYNPTGDSTYGIVTHSQFIQVLLVSADEMLIAQDSGGMPSFTGDTERFYSVASKIADFTSPEGIFVNRDFVKFANTSNASTIEFKNGRFLMLSETLGHINNLRDYENEFGVLPSPKYSEDQEGYRSMVATYGTLLTTVPITNNELERTGVILDMLAHQSYISLMEPYYETYLTQKGARNEDSVEMLQIIRNTRVLNVGQLYGWTSSLLSAAGTKLSQGDADLASTVAAQSKSINKAIEKTITAMEG